MKKLIPITANGYTKKFFKIDITDDMELDLMPKLEVDAYHTATTAILLNDAGLKKWGIKKEAYLLFSPSADTYKDQVLLVRQEGEYIIRVGSHVDPMETILTTPGDKFPPLQLNSENIRIVGVMSGFINPFEGIKIVVNNRFKKMEELYH